MTFADQIRPLIANVGGTAKAAKALRMTPQVVNRWLRGLDPVWAMQVGVIAILKQLDAENRLFAVNPEAVMSRPERPPCFGGMLKAPKKV